MGGQDITPSALAADQSGAEKETHRPPPNLNPELFVVGNGKDTSGQQGPMPASECEPEETYPEGGLQAWLVVLGCWLALFSALGLMNTLATFQAYVSTHQLSGIDEGTIGWIFSVYTFITFFLGVYIGPVFDKYGPRYLVLAGSIFLVTSLMLMSISQVYWHFLLSFGVLAGLASSLLFTPSIASIGHFFMVRRGFATGIASTAGSLGGVIFPMMLQSLFGKFGWGWAIRILAFLGLALTAVANLLIRSRLPPAKNASAHPDVRIFRNAAFAWTTAGVFMLEFALFIPLTYISLYALSQGFSDAFSFQILTVLNAGSVLGRALPGYFADIVGPFNANMVCILLSIIACFGVWLPVGHTTPGIIIFAILFGFSSGSNISLTPVCVGRLCRTQEYGRYYATCYTVVSFACLVGIPIAGTILKANNGSYWGLITTTGVIYTASLTCFAAAKLSRVGWSFWAVF